MQIENTILTLVYNYKSQTYYYVLKKNLSKNNLHGSVTKNCNCKKSLKKVIISWKLKSL